MIKYLEVTVVKKTTTTCVLAVNDTHYDLERDIGVLRDHALACVQRDRRYWADEYPDYEVEEERLVRDGSDAEKMPLPDDWLDRVMTRVMRDYRDPLGDVVVEDRDNGGWRRVLVVGAARAVVDGPAFMFGRFVTLDGRPALESFGGSLASLWPALVEDFRAAFPGTEASDTEIQARFEKELGWQK